MQKLRRRRPFLQEAVEDDSYWEDFTDMGSYLTTEKHNLAKTDFNFSLFQNLREEEEEVEGVKKAASNRFST